MFQYMRDAGIVGYGRPKRYGKEVVRVFVKKMQQPGAAFLMIKNIRATSQLRDFLYALDNKPFNDLYAADYDICSQETNGELTVPETWKPISLPQKVSLDSPFGSYLFEFSQKGKKILYHRKAVFNISKQIPVGDYERLKNFLNEVSKSDAVQLLFFTR